MSALIDYKPVDREFYESRLRRFLPDSLIDIHSHVWLAAHAAGAKTAGVPARTVTWPQRVARENPIEDLLETYRLLLPGKTVTPLIFPFPAEGGNLEVLNGYAAACAARCRLPALALASPEWSAAEFERRILAGAFLGAKVYLTYAPAHLPAEEIRIYDFLPPHQLDMLDRHGWIVMLHLPRSGRLRDPMNLAQLMEIDERYPSARVIIAHVGRAYSPEDVGNAFEVLAPAKRLLFDISANTCEQVFRRLLGAVGPRRVLFGTDLPIVRMRMRRLSEGGRYVNLVPRGLYGDVSGDPHLRATDGEEADRLTFFLYEEIDAFRRAAEAQGLTPADVEDVFFNNAKALLEGAGGSRDGVTK